jgi:hypothetical protein
MVEEYDLFVRIGFSWKVGYIDAILAKCRLHPKSLSQQSSESFPVERRLFLDKLKLNIDNFNEEYSFEILCVERQCAYENSILYWRNKEGKKARENLKPFIQDGFRYFSIYYMTFFPYSVFIALKKLKHLITS